MLKLLLIASLPSINLPHNPINYGQKEAILIFIFALAFPPPLFPRCYGILYVRVKAKKKISALLDLQPEEALRISNGTEERVPVGKSYKLTTLFLIKPGERVPTIL